MCFNLKIQFVFVWIAYFKNNTFSLNVGVFNMIKVIFTLLENL